MSKSVLISPEQLSDINILIQWTLQRALVEDNELPAYIMVVVDNLSALTAELNGDARSSIQPSFLEQLANYQD